MVNVLNNYLFMAKNVFLGIEKIIKEENNVGHVPLVISFVFHERDYLKNFINGINLLSNNDYFNYVNCISKEDKIYKSFVYLDFGSNVF